LIFFLFYKRIQFSTAEDIFALAGIGFAAVAALWASVNLIEVHIPKDMLQLSIPNTRQATEG
jgi:hypothetical protein